MRCWKRLRRGFTLEMRFFAHFGSIQNYSQLRNHKAKTLLEGVILKINSSKGHNPILFELKEDVKLILMIELNKTPVTSVRLH